MSPPLVVAYALAGRIDLDLTIDPVGIGTGGKPVYLRDIWPTQKEVQDAVSQSIHSGMFTSNYKTIFDGDQEWKKLPVPTGETYVWDRDSTYIKRAPYFDDMPARPAEIKEIKGARVLAKLGNSVTTDHISPAGSIKANSPAGKYLQEHGVSPSDFNSYGSRRGNHEVMVRGTFANVRLRNQLAPGSEGGITKHFPSGREVHCRRCANDRAGRQRIWIGFVARLGRERAAAAGHPRGDRRKLRAHSPFQPGRHGHLAAPVPC
jgi:aconitate hydratase